MNIGGTYNKTSGYALDVSGTTFINSGPNMSSFPLNLTGGNNNTLNFGIDHGNGGYTQLTRDNDNMIIWDVSSVGLVIAPFNNNATTAGIRVSPDGLSVNTSWLTSTTGYALYVTGNTYFTGQAQAVSFNGYSDYRIKENVVPLDVVFTVDNLNPVTYTNTKTQKQDIGLIAHELQEHYPFLVNGTKDGEELQSVNYMGLIGILIKEIQSLKKEVSLMKLQIAELQNK